VGTEGRFILLGTALKGIPRKVIGEILVCPDTLTEKPCLSLEEEHQLQIAPLEILPP
jgi:hypothetical protein